MCHLGAACVALEGKVEMRRVASVLALSFAAVASSGGETKFRPLAWARFPDAEESYAGKPYLWLGRVSFEVRADVRPAPGHVVELLWGSKNDTRDASLTINGKKITVKGGGYDGFRWLRVPVPDGVSGERYTLSFAPASGKPAFIAEVRISTAGAPQADLSAPRHRMEVKVARAAATAGGAFAERREFWDGEPPPPEKPLPDKALEEAFRQAARNGRRANEMFFRSRKFVEGWLAHADPKSGLLPRNLGRHRTIWNAQDCAADLYPFMVLTAALTDRALFEGRMRDILRTERRLTSRLDRLPDTWSFTKQDFASPKPDLGRIIFGASEYAKDGLMPLTEWLGPSAWSERLVELEDDTWRHAPVETPFGKIPSTNVEVNGEQLQVLSRLFWMTGERKYLEWAIRLGDYYLLGKNHPTRDFRTLRLRDHGCEILSGLCELYAAVNFALPEKKKQYEKPIHEMCDRVLEVGRDPNGMLYDWINPKTGAHSRGICDTWGYNYNGIYTVYLIDHTEAYRQAVRKALASLYPKLINHNWGGADGFADSIESAINLYNREPIPSVEKWLDSEVRDMWSRQRPDGVIEGWYGDGNTARTAIMYAFLKTRGLWVEPWREDVCVGAVEREGRLCISLWAEKPWSGKLIFDVPRHKLYLHLPLDYPRINQFPEWFTVEAGKRYLVRDLTHGDERIASGTELREGLAVGISAKSELRLLILPR